MKRTRLVFVLLGLSLAWIALILRAAQLQILPDSRMAELQKRQYRTIIELPARRGTITDRAGKELAVSLPVYSMYADPKVIAAAPVHGKQFAKILAKKMGWAPVHVIEKIKSKEKRFVWLKRQMSKNEMEGVKALNLAGLAFVEESERVYPNDSLLSQVLGFVGQEGRGLEGIELKYDKELRGENQKLRVEKDARGRPLLVDGRLFTEPPAGIDLQLTIDSELQFVLEKQLHESLVQNGADNAIGIVMDAQTSEILALGYAPTFDANRPRDFDADFWRNKSLTDSFEPGSTMKTFVIAGGLKNNVVKPSTKFFCELGKFKVGPYFIKEAMTTEKFGDLTVGEILAHSSNIGTSKIALKMGDNMVRQTLSDFGFGERTGIEMPGESKGILQALPWRDHLLANISFGQGVSATPLQVAAAYAAIANGGVLKQPILVKAFHSTHETEQQEFAAKDVRRVLTPEQANIMRMMLMEATGENSTGKNARISGFPVAGKTGTAQKVVNGVYSKDQYFSSFVGFVPANDPRFVIYVAIDNPRKGYYGAEVAAPLFSKVAGYAVRKAGLAPILITEKNMISGKSPEKAVAERKQSEAIEKIRALAKTLDVSDTNRMPDFKGLTLREVYSRVRGTPIKVRISGRGVVASTLPLPGENLPPNKTVKVYLEQH
jgi:cell division protein FtsI (penicillin-binding protein 3)